MSFACVSSYLAGLFALAHDPSSEVRKPVCTGLVQLLHLQPERLAPHMQSIIEYMLESTQVPFTYCGPQHRWRMVTLHLCSGFGLSGGCSVVSMPACCNAMGRVRYFKSCRHLWRCWTHDALVMDRVGTRVWLWSHASSGPPSARQQCHSQTG